MSRDSEIRSCRHDVVTLTSNDANGDTKDGNSCVKISKKQTTLPQDELQDNDTQAETVRQLLFF